MRLWTGRELREDAQRILDRERERLVALVPSGNVSLTGGASAADALTLGDVDLLLRVPPADFAAAVEALQAGYPVVNREIWTDEFATFDAPGHARPAGIAVTAIGMEHDVLFVRSWQLLASDRRLLERYNVMKRQRAMGPADRYRAAKSNFFARLAADDAVRSRGRM